MGQLVQRNAVFIDAVFINPVLNKSIDYSTKTFFFFCTTALIASTINQEMMCCLDELSNKISRPVIQSRKNIFKFSQTSV